MYKKTILSNGLQILSHKMPGTMSVSVGIWIKAGGRNETAAQSGISHFVEHLLFKGSRNYSCNELKEAIEGVGGSFNGFTSMECTCFLVKVLHTHLDLAIEVLSDMVLYPRLAPRDIQKEKGVILEEIKMYQDQPAHLVHDILEQILWQDQALGRPLIGTEKTVTTLGQKDLVEYRRRCYVLRNMLITVTGDIDHRRVVKAIRARFKGCASGQEMYFPTAVHGEGKKIKVHRKMSEQTRLAMGFYGYDMMHKDRYSISLLHILLGGNMSSRLFNELREKRGMAYDVNTGVKRYVDTGVFTIEAGLEHGKLPTVISLVMQQLDKIARVRISADELKRAKEYCIGQFYLMMEDTLEHMLWIGDECLEYKEVHMPHTIAEAIHKVSREDILRVAKRLFQVQNLHIAVVGPFSRALQRKIEERI